MWMGSEFAQQGHQGANLGEIPAFGAARHQADDGGAERLHVWKCLGLLPHDPRSSPLAVQFATGTRPPPCPIPWTTHLFEYELKKHLSHIFRFLPGFNQNRNMQFITYKDCAASPYRTADTCNRAATGSLGGSTLRGDGAYGASAGREAACPRCRQACGRARVTSSRVAGHGAGHGAGQATTSASMLVGTSRARRCSKSGARVPRSGTRVCSARCGRFSSPGHT